MTISNTKRKRNIKRAKFGVAFIFVLIAYILVSKYRKIKISTHSNATKDVLSNNLTFGF